MEVLREEKIIKKYGDLKLPSLLVVHLSYLLDLDMDSDLEAEEWKVLQQR